VAPEVRHPFLEEVFQLGFARMEDPECQKKVFCEMAAFGRDDESANWVQRIMATAVDL